MEAAAVRYLVAGGLAVNAHGYIRFTRDVDLVVQLVPDNIGFAFAALSELGYRPTVPITAARFRTLIYESVGYATKKCKC